MSRTRIASPDESGSTISAERAQRSHEMWMRAYARIGRLKPEAAAELARIDERREADRRIDRLAQVLGNILSIEHTDALHGRKFRDGSKGRRPSSLTRLMDEALAKLPRKSSAEVVLHKMRDLDPGNTVIDDVDEDLAIYWHDGIRDRTMTFKRFRNLLSERRQKK